MRNQFTPGTVARIVAETVAGTLHISPYETNLAPGPLPGPFSLDPLYNPIRNKFDPGTVAGTVAGSLHISPYETNSATGPRGRPRDRCQDRYRDPSYKPIRNQFGPQAVAGSIAGAVARTVSESLHISPYETNLAPGPLPEPLPEPWLLPEPLPGLFI